MTETKTVTTNGNDYSVTLKRFDDYTEPSGPSYHGHHVTIEGHGLSLNARKYDDESQMNILFGIRESDLDAIEIVRDIARQIFRTDQLSLLTPDNPTPYKKI